MGDDETIEAHQHEDDAKAVAHDRFRIKRQQAGQQKQTGTEADDGDPIANYFSNIRRIDMTRC